MREFAKIQEPKDNGMQLNAELIFGFRETGDPPLGVGHLPHRRDPCYNSVL